MQHAAPAVAVDLCNRGTGTGDRQVIGDVELAGPEKVSAGGYRNRVRAG
ncbi:MAG TPA: hypothetical protein VN812_09810 [Candidatus Acidoferrales bacterium]|nr:hypothetical protein [Candidatus Acidoferrales bacterium]